MVYLLCTALASEIQQKIVNLFGSGFANVASFLSNSTVFRSAYDENVPEFDKVIIALHHVVSAFFREKHC